MTEFVASIQVYALVELSHKGIDAYDGKDQPENEAHQQNVEDGGKGANQSIDDDLK